MSVINFSRFTDVLIPPHQVSWAGLPAFRRNERYPSVSVCRPENPVCKWNRLRPQWRLLSLQTVWPPERQQLPPRWVRQPAFIRFLFGWLPAAASSSTSLYCLDSPVFISHPHFFNADPVLLDFVQGLSPNEEEHGLFIDIHPVSARTHARTQAP